MVLGDDVTDMFLAIVEIFARWQQIVVCENGFAVSDVRHHKRRRAK